MGKKQTQLLCFLYRDIGVSLERIFIMPLRNLFLVVIIHANKQREICIELALVLLGLPKLGLSASDMFHIAAFL